MLTTLSTMPKVVDFPEPFGPKIPYTWPFSMLSETWLTANIGPYRLLRFLRVRMVSKTKIFGGWTDKFGKCYRIFALVFGQKNPRTWPGNIALTFLFFVKIHQVIIHLAFFVPAFFNEFFGAFRVDEIQFNLNIRIETDHIFNRFAHI